MDYYQRIYSLWMFQSTRPRGARRYPRRMERIHRGFNPRAHEGRDLSANSHTYYC